MKVRADFVTNSSSSSYIIMYKAIPEIEKEVVEKYPFIKNYIRMLEKVLIGDSEQIFSEKELDDYFLSKYSWGGYNTLEKIFEDEDGLKENYENYKAKINEGYNIIFKTVDNHDESTGEILNNLDDGINFIVESEY